MPSKLALRIVAMFGYRGVIAAEKVDAELADVRKALESAEAYMTSPHGGIGCMCRCSAIDGHTDKCPIVKAITSMEVRK